MIFLDFLKAVGQIGDPRFRRVLMLGIVLTFAVLIAVYAAALWGLHTLTGTETITELVGEVQWLPDLISWTSFAVLVVMSIFLMVPVASAITSMFLDEVAGAVEAKHYPGLPTVSKVPFWDAFRDTVNFLGVLILANAIALFVYALVPFAAIFIFWALNGYLLGREYFQMMAMRRIGRQAATDMRKAHGGQIWIAGCLMTVPLSIPLINLVIPILASATFTHLYHRLSQHPREAL
jgi:uncharacterized protein involved in cysteine biosynthesis